MVWRSVKGSKRNHFYEEINGISLCGRFGSDNYPEEKKQASCYFCGRKLYKNMGLLVSIGDR